MIFYLEISIIEETHNMWKAAICHPPPSIFQSIVQCERGRGVKRIIMLLFKFYPLYLSDLSPSLLDFPFPLSYVWDH